MTEEPWNKHTPGDPMPCKCGDSVVEARFRSGACYTALAEDWKWGKIENFPGSEITAWRFVERKGEDVIADETRHIATAAASLDDPYAALSQHLHGDGDTPTAGGRLIASAAEAAEAAVDAWRTRALAAETEAERLRAAIPERDAEVRRAALEEAAQEADDWFYDAEKDCVTECRLGNAIRALIDTPPTPACATPGCPHPPVIRLDDRCLCRDCYATHDFGDDA